MCAAIFLSDMTFTCPLPFTQLLADLSQVIGIAMSYAYISKFLKFILENIHLAVTSQLSQVRFCESRFSGEYVALTGAPCHLSGRYSCMLTWGLIWLGHFDMQSASRKVALA